MTHGYLLSGSGSNVYVQNLCRALVREGHEVHLLCQDPDPLAHDFVNELRRAGEGGVALLGEKETLYPGRCALYRPEIGDLLPVYVYDDYPGWRVKTFLDLSGEEFDLYVEMNVAALTAVMEHSGATHAVTNHSLPGPEVARRALEGTGIPYASIVHGSCLQYAVRKSEEYTEVARRGLSGAASIVALSIHSAGTIAEDFPILADRTISLPGGVDTGLFRPDALDAGATKALCGGPGRGSGQREKLREVVDRFPQDGSAEELAVRLKGISGTYEPRRHDVDAGERIRALMEGSDPVVLYVGKFIHSKGVHCLISGFARVHRETGARLVVIGYGAFREALEALVRSLSTNNRRVLDLLAANGRLFEGGPPSPMEHFEVTEELLRNAARMEEHIEFVGPLYHAELARVLPAADAAVAPSIFPETFGLVAAEAAASGVPPFVADHSGLREAGGYVGRGLPFDVRVSLAKPGDFSDNLAGALIRYLGLPEDERRRCRETVRRNSVESLGWGALASRVVDLLRG